MIIQVGNQQIRGVRALRLGDGDWHGQYLIQHLAPKQYLVSEMGVAGWQPLCRVAPHGKVVSKYNQQTTECLVESFEQAFRLVQDMDQQQGELYQLIQDHKEKKEC